MVKMGDRSSVYMQAKSLPSLYSRCLLCVLSTNVFRIPNSCVYQTRQQPKCHSMQPSSHVGAAANCAGMPAVPQQKVYHLSQMMKCCPKMHDLHMWRLCLVRGIYTRASNISLGQKIWIPLRKEQWIFLPPLCKISNCLSASSCLPPILCNEDVNRTSKCNLPGMSVPLEFSCF